MSALAFALRPHPAGQPGSDAAKKRIKAVQACRRQVAGLEEDEAWRAFLGRAAGGQTSLRAMGYRDLGKVLDALHAAGAPRRDGGASRSRYADDLQMRMIRGLWIECADAGVVRNRAEEALNGFVRRQTGQDLGAQGAGGYRGVEGDVEAGRAGPGGRCGVSSSAQQFYIIDLRPEWRKQRYITLWRPRDAGYCWSLPWAGKYDLEAVDAGGRYYAAQVYGGTDWSRFPAPCEAVEALATQAPRPGDIDGDVGPILRNLAPIRAKLLTAARLPASVMAAP